MIYLISDFPQLSDRSWPILSSMEDFCNGAQALVLRALVSLGFETSDGTCGSSDWGEYVTNRTLFSFFCSFSFCFSLNSDTKSFHIAMYMYKYREYILLLLHSTQY